MIKEKTIQVVNDFGVPFNVRIHEKNSKKIVSFYDARYEHTEYGQFIASYYADTIAEHDNKLILYLDIENWQVSHENIKEIQKHLNW